MFSVTLDNDPGMCWFFTVIKLEEGLTVGLSFGAVTLYRAVLFSHIHLECLSLCVTVSSQITSSFARSLLEISSIESDDTVILSDDWSLSRKRQRAEDEAKLSVM